MLKLLRCAPRLSALLCLLALAACGRPEPAAAPPRAPPTTTITALVWAPDWPQEMQQVAAAFSRAHPDIKVELQFMIGNSVEENLKPKVAANQLPDLVSVNPNSYAAGLADQGLLADLGGGAAWDNMLDVLKPDWTSPEKKRFGVAGGVAATLIYYNKELFRQAGVERLPADFDQFLALCERLKRAGITPLVFDAGFPNMLGNGPFSFGFANNVAAGRPGWREALAAGKLDLDTEAAADIFGKIKLLAERGYVQKNFLNTGYDEGIQLFAGGKVAMAFHGTWAAGRLMASKRFASGVFVPPWNAAGRAVVPVVGSETGFAVCETRNKRAALMLLDFIVGQGFPLQQNKRQNVPPMKRVPGPVRNDAQITAYVAAVGAAAQTSGPYYSFLPAPAIELLHTLLHDVLAGKTSPRQAAAALDASVRAAAAQDNR
ncbi:sugar ABC transporter substrate-binding protein [Janthinobacterium sp. BJB412]|nr:sugar ABC transporter substrate-binding protein [Janthinobacterium sp. BJB412]